MAPLGPRHGGATVAPVCNMRERVQPPSHGDAGLSSRYPGRREGGSIGKGGGESREGGSSVGGGKKAPPR